jgi:hypothetical protein
MPNDNNKTKMCGAWGEKLPEGNNNNNNVRYFIAIRLAAVLIPTMLYDRGAS